MLLLILVYKMWWLLRVSKLKISRLNNAIEYKWLFVQTTKNSNYNPSPDNISPSVHFLFLKYRINLPLFSHRAIVNFLFSEACFEKCPNQTSLQYEIELSLTFFLLLMYTILLTYLLWVLFLSFQVLYVMYKGIINMMPIQHDVTFLVVWPRRSNLVAAVSMFLRSLTNFLNYFSINLLIHYFFSSVWPPWGQADFSWPLSKAMHSSLKQTSLKRTSSNRELR